MRQIMEKCYEFNTPLHILFVDFKQAFDSINRIYLINAMYECGIPSKLVRLADMTLQNSEARVIVGGLLSQNFDITAGVRQGDCLSAVLFNLTMSKVLKELKLSGTILYKSKQACVYADDIALIARNISALQEMLSAIEMAGKPAGLVINTDKTKYMKMEVCYSINPDTNITIGNHTFERVNNFTYLEAQINNKSFFH